MAVAVDQLTFFEESERLGARRQLFWLLTMTHMMLSGRASVSPMITFSLEPHRKNLVDCKSSNQCPALVPRVMDFSL